MDQNALPYNNIFTVEDRKKIIAQTMRELRKAKGFSQKEVAAQVEISQATYSAYERGRNEPPAEILVRLSYVFNCPVDVLIQRDRLYRNAGDALKMFAATQAQIVELEAALASGEQDNPAVRNMLAALKKMLGMMEQTMQRADIAQALDEPLD